MEVLVRLALFVSQTGSLGNHCLSIAGVQWLKNRCFIYSGFCCCFGHNGTPQMEPREIPKKNIIFTHRKFQIQLKHVYLKHTLYVFTIFCVSHSFLYGVYRHHFCVSHSFLYAHLSYNACKGRGKQYIPQ